MFNLNQSFNFSYRSNNASYSKGFTPSSPPPKRKERKNDNLYPGFHHPYQQCDSNGFFSSAISLQSSHILHHTFLHFYFTSFFFIKNLCPPKFHHLVHITQLLNQVIKLYTVYKRNLFQYFKPVPQNPLIHSF